MSTPERFDTIYKVDSFYITDADLSLILSVLSNLQSDVGGSALVVDRLSRILNSKTNVEYLTK